MTRRNPWSRPIDYEKSIADDLELIAVNERIAPLCAARPNVPKGAVVDAVMLALFDEGARKALDLDLDQIASYLVLNAFPCDSFGALPKGWYSIGDDVSRRVAEFVGDMMCCVPTEETRVARLKLGKRRLSAHRRNQKKYGRAS